MAVSVGDKKKAEFCYIGGVSIVTVILQVWTITDNFNLVFTQGITRNC